MGAIETKTFKSGNSVAVRLPKELGLAENVAVTIERIGGVLTIRPRADPKTEKQRLIKMIEDLRTIGPVGTIGARDAEIPERPGI